MNISAREAAFLAYFQFLKEDTFIEDSLKTWEKTSSPTISDKNLAYQIAYGTVKQSLSLDYLAQQIANKKTLSLKIKEKALLRISLYQHYFLDKVPLYAIANEMLKIAKKHCSIYFCKFLNAILRNIEKTPFKLPDDLSIAYSYPSFFIKLLLDQYSLESVITILKIGNLPGKIMAKMRKEPFEVIEIEPKDIEKMASSKEFYIQNITPVTIVKTLSQKITSLSSILDLCAAPGGKLLAFHDLFKEAKLFANDVTEDKIKRLKENCEKYDLKVTFFCSRGEDLATHEKFDLIILDVPCSNSGVLNKRCEARWRISEENLLKLVETQKKLLQHALSLLAPNGKIAYITCSILKAENEDIIKSVLKKYPLSLLSETLILPSENGFDGGYGALLEVSNV